MSRKILTVTLNPCIDKTMTISGFEYGGLNRVKKIRVDVGGKGINVSKVLSSFGVNVFVCGIIAGKQGSQIENFLDSKSISYSLAQTEGETRTNYKIVDDKNQITTEFNEPGFHVDNEILEECIQNIISVLPETEIMILSGSAPSGVGSDVYKRMIEIARSYDAKVILDADGEKLRLGIEALPYAIKPNLFELEQLVGRKLDSNADIISAARDYIDFGINMVIISMGANGALFVSGTEVYQATPFAINCKSTVGAGDSMVAAVAYGLQHGHNLEAIARLATSAGTITASKEGSSVCSFDEVQEKMHLVQVKKL